jgi:tetratricopeptide (TPR) repeat protein
MRRTLQCFQVICLAAMVIAIALAPGISSAATCEKWAGKVVSLQGTVDAKVAGGTQWQPAKLNDTYCPGDMLRTGRRSRAEVALQNHPLLRLDENSTITFAGMKDERTSLIDMLSGAALFFSRVTRNLEVRTATVNAGVEGTEFFIRVEEDKTSLSIFEGKVLASNEAGSLAVTTGQSAVVEKGKAPVPVIVVRPRDAVRWSLHYPPVIYARPADFGNVPDPALRDMMQKSVESYWKGDLAGAFSAIEGAPVDVSDPRFFTYRASLLLTVGRIDEAGADIDQVLRLDPKNSDAFALQSVISVAQNEKGKALDLAQKAVEADPKSPTAQIALSYAQQATFNLQGASNSVNEAVKLDPENALAWARMAELRQSFGELDGSLTAAKKAAALSPDLSRTQTVLGFAYLTRVNIKEAMKAFGKAIEFDQADPLPRLGLGLAKIREGNLEEGRRELEIAITLDPDNGLLRSYLGKAYYEEKRDKLASGQYDMAKTLDPLDPTSYFYDAILKQTVNRPVEALHELEKAIELNDNRAVYRSRLLLDQDLAARSASLARIYSDLGFQERALVEGWKSVNTDPANYSAHRFLADSYSALPRHEIARVSELLQSQLLQPINTTPIQPRLAESNLFLLSASGPGSLSFNEYNPIFNMDGVNFQASGLSGEDSTWAGEGVLAGIYKKASFSGGYTHFETDGWRTNGHQDDNIANVFFQLELSPNTSIQAEYRYRDTEYGDLQLRFFPDDFFPSQISSEKWNSIRLGARHNFSPNSVLLGSFTYLDLDVGLTEPDALFILETPSFATNTELQHLFRSRYVNLTTGIGYANVNQTTGITITIPPPFGPIQDSIPEDKDHTNIYMYSYIRPWNNLTITAGASGDFVNADNQEADENQFNPKFGIIWNPLPGTTVRAAAFRVLTRTLITNQTLEPTQVAGFNQFFDDFPGTKAWRYGGALDQKFSNDLFGGVEYSKRDLEVPWSDFLGNLNEAKWHEELARGYLLWTPHPWVALRAEYQYEHIKRDEELTDGVKEMDTHRLPLGVNFFHPSGLSASLTTTYYDQNGTFDRFFVGLEDGSDTFWLTDASISFRLPKRYGFITVGAKNLFDQDFKYYDLDWKNPAIQPTRFFFGKITLALGN